MVEFESPHFHPLLKRQINKHNNIAKDQRKIKDPLIDAVNETYLSHDQERILLERSLEISSAELMQKNSEIRAIFEAFPDIFLRIGLDGKILDYKLAPGRIANLFPPQLVGSNLKSLEVLQLGRLFEGLLGKIAQTKDLLTVEHSAYYNDDLVYYEARIKSLHQDQAIIIIRDITERKIAEEQLKFEATHDRLTRLPNRALLLDRLNMAIVRNRRHTEYNFAVIFADFDRFKLVNDSLGHPIGDAVLISISNRLNQSLRGVDTVARIGGDEFCLILDEVKSEAEAIMVADRLQKIISEPFFVEKKEIFLTVSVGIVISKQDDERTAEDFIRESDIAMYNAKKNGRAQFAVFSKEMQERAVTILNLEADLHRAVEHKEFIIHYQPILSLTTPKIIRMEALVRWVHPKKGLVPPMDFISLAEETGQILKIGEYVLLNACKQCQEWHRAGFEEVEVAVNFSALQFHHQDLPELIGSALSLTNLDPKYLVVEITESVAMKNINHTIMTLNKLKEMNVSIAIDDFGTGYSSLESLVELPIDSLKIDRKFLANFTSRPQSICLTSAIIGLAHNLGLKVVSEGIEDNDQLKFLSSNNCDEGQGFFFSKPLPPEEVSQILKKFNGLK